jgi:hypothetical protein
VREVGEAKHAVDLLLKDRLIFLGEALRKLWRKRNLLSTMYFGETPVLSSKQSIN